MTWRALPVQGAGAKPALVVSHERSGTHFLMNTLDLNFGYLSWTDIDELNGVNVRSTPDLMRFLFATPWPWQSVLKCHYHAAYFPFLPQLARRFDILHVVREPEAALRSFWHFVRARGPRHGPRRDSFAEFVRAKPRGDMERYQREPVATTAARWREHTASWLEAGERLDGAITVVRYEDLADDFASVVERLSARLGRRPGPLVRPSRNVKVVTIAADPSLSEELDEGGRELLERETGDVWRSVAGVSGALGGSRRSS